MGADAERKGKGIGGRESGGGGGGGGGGDEGGVVVFRLSLFRSLPAESVYCRCYCLS